ncbi:unnamed protein product [Auanema sp. JU1783]|nr:unnamed protein product [Auanema sp. JU1783]
MAVMDIYPMEDEILSLDNDKKCNICDRLFSNVSALRLHRVKTHKIVESIEDKRIFYKSTDGQARTFVFHCPVQKCRERKVKFQGMRNLKQHYLRVGVELQRLQSNYVLIAGPYRKNVGMRMWNKVLFTKRFCLS